MKCLWPSFGIHTRAIFLLLALVCTLSTKGWCSRSSIEFPSLIAHEQTLERVTAHVAEFAPMYASAFSATCASTRLPEALLTPDPIMEDLSDDLHVRISFIIGADGRVHSAFILDSGSRNQDRTILRAVGGWRFRPALCNGVPTPMEDRVTFVLP